MIPETASNSEMSASSAVRGVAAPPRFIIYTDGSAIGNPGPCGVGIYMVSADTGEALGRAYGIGHANVPRAELMAVALAVRLTPEGAEIDLYSDSEYVVRQVPRLQEYREAGWKRETRNGYKRLWNRDLWQKLDGLLRTRVVRVHKVRAHSGVEGNELADQLAGIGATWANRSAVAAGAGGDACLCPEPVPFRSTASFVPDAGDVDRGTARVSPPTEAQIDRVAFLENRSFWHGRVRFGPGYHGWHGRPRWRRSRARTHRMVDLHIGNHFDYVHRFRKAAYRAALSLKSGDPSEECTEFFGKAFGYVTDFQLLRAAWEHNESGGSLAKGVDGRGYDSYSEQEKFEELRQLSYDLESGTWRPGGLRRVTIEKPEGRGTRPIDIPTVRDRVVETALNLALAPILDPIMHDDSVGFRPGKSVQEGLARAIWYVENQGLTTVAALDLRKAFSRVPKNRLCNVVRQLLPSRELADVICRVATRPLPRGDGIRRNLGLAQGGPLSPLLLNLYLTKHLDVPWATEHPGTPIVRYADDLLLLGETPGQVQSAVASLRLRLEPHGMVFRDETWEPVNLESGDRGEHLGYLLGKQDGRVRAELPWRVNYKDKGIKSRLPTNDTDMGFLRGILDHAGPSYPGYSPRDQVEVQDFIDDFLDVFHLEGSHPVVPRDEVHRIWYSSFSRWLRLRARVDLCMRRARARVPDAPHPGTLLDDWVDAARRVVAVRAKSS